MGFVVFKGKKYEIGVVKIGCLNKKGYFQLTYLKLRNINIKDLDEIEGLSEIKNLKSLDLSSNKTTELKGLEKLKNLRSLYDLCLMDNKIREIERLDDFKNLSILDR